VISNLPAILEIVRHLVHAESTAIGVLVLRNPVARSTRADSATATRNAFPAGTRPTGVVDPAIAWTRGDFTGLGGRILTIVAHSQRVIRHPPFEVHAEARGFIVGVGIIKLGVGAPLDRICDRT